MSNSQSGNFLKQPFFILCFLEFFERFGYYGFNYISIYFYISKLGFSESQATTLMGGFAALTYVFNAVGGYVADNVLGIKRTMFVGAALLCLGYASLAIGSSLSPHLVYPALAFIIIGSCLFKPAPTNLIAAIYGSDKSKLDSTYTYFYMSINMGSFCASILIPLLAKNVGYTVALLVCSIGLLLGIIYNIKHYYVIREVDNRIGLIPLNVKKIAPFILSVILGIVFVTVMLENDGLINWLLTIASVIIFTLFIWQIIKEESRSQKQKMIVAVVLLFYAVVFFVIYQQKNTSFMLFNKHHVNLNFLGWDINPQTVPGFLGTSGIILLSPIFAAMYRRLGKRDLALPQKFAIGLFLSASAYGLLFLVCLFTNPSDKISFAWEILSISVFFASSELLISALGVSLMAQLVPDRMRGFAMGTWFITSALGIKLGSYVASLVANNAGKGKIDVVYSASEQIASFEKYQHLFGSIAAFGLACAVIAWLIGGRLTRMIGNN